MMKPSHTTKLAAIIIAALACVVHVAAQTPQAGGLPVVKIDTKNEAPISDKTNYVNMTFTLTDFDNPGNDITVVNNEYGIRGRGNTTWSYDKQPYRIKFDKKQSLFGLPAAKSWVLLAEYLDETLILNMTAFELANILGLPYNHTYHHVQLYVNGVYRGIYGLTEQNQTGAGRVDIDGDYGWFIEIDANYDEEPKFRTTSYNLPVIIKSPEVENVDVTGPAYDFVRNDFNELCDSMTSVNFPENGYRDLIDMNTFIDFLLTNEVVYNNELWWPKSMYLYKDNGGKINMGPLWDFDWAFGYNDNGAHFMFYTGRTVKHSFFNRFFEDPVFLVKYKERWNEKYSEILAVSEFIGDMGTKLEKPAAENFNIWRASGNYAQHITNMKRWWDNRCSWLNSELNKIEILPANKTFPSQTFGYTEIAPQTFSLVSYGDITDLSATLRKTESSGFEISAELNATPAGNGVYLTTISVKPKSSLPAAIYTDTLVVSGNNQEKPFSFKMPLRFVVNKGEIPANVVFPVFGEPIVYNPSRKLSEIALKGSGDGIFVWENGDIVPPVSAVAKTYNVIFIPNDVVTYVQLSKFIELKVEKANPSYILPQGLTTVYGSMLSNVKLPSGWSWEGTGTVGDVGTRTHLATFTHKDVANYNIMTGIEITVTVTKFNPTVPVGITAVYGDMLSSVELPSGWSWEGTGTVGNAGTRVHLAAFNHKDTANYNLAAGIEVMVTVAKADPTVPTVPVGITAVYGDMLSSVELPSGWSWEGTGTVGNAGTRVHLAAFTPEDTVNYNIMAGIEVTVTVAKADPTVPAVPAGLTAVYGDMLSSVELPAGWSWEGTGTVGNAGTRGHKSVFTPEDTENYNVAAGIDITVTVAKANPAVAWPPDVVVTAGQALDAATLAFLTNGGGPAGAFSWTEPETPAVEAGVNQKSVTFTPHDSANYNTLTENVTVIAITGNFTAGPNPVAKRSGMINFFRQGKQVESCELRIYDAMGNTVNKIRINDTSTGSQARRQVGSWDLKDARGRPVSAGTYLVRGQVKTHDGKNEKMSLMLGVR